MQQSRSISLKSADQTRRNALRMRSERSRRGRHVAGAATQQRDKWEGLKGEEKKEKWQREDRGRGGSNECPLPALVVIAVRI